MTPYTEQPAEVRHVENQGHFFRYADKGLAYAKSKEINGTVIKEQGWDIWYVFKDVPNRTIGSMGE